MDNDFNFCDNAPEYFGFCLKTDCASAGECLRAFAARDLTPVRSTFLKEFYYKFNRRYFGEDLFDCLLSTSAQATKPISTIKFTGKTAQSIA